MSWDHAVSSRMAVTCTSDPGETRMFWRNNMFYPHFYNLHAVSELIKISHYSFPLSLDKYPEKLTSGTAVEQINVQPTLKNLVVYIK